MPEIAGQRLRRIGLTPEISTVLSNREKSTQRPSCVAAQRGFELLNPETRGRSLAEP
jgi:hypothetical protein